LWRVGIAQVKERCQQAPFRRGAKSLRDRTSTPRPRPASQFGHGSNGRTNLTSAARVGVPLLDRAAGYWSLMCSGALDRDLGVIASQRPGHLRAGPQRSALHEHHG
jgi:hypothetical protein